MLDEHFLVGKLPPAQQAGQLVPVSQFIIAGLGLPRLLLARCRGRRQPLSLGLLLLFLLLFVVAVSSILSQQSYQRVHHLGLREVEKSVTICSIKLARPAGLYFPSSQLLSLFQSKRQRVASQQHRQGTERSWLASLPSHHGVETLLLSRQAMLWCQAFPTCHTPESTRSQPRQWLFGSELLSLTSSRNGDQ